jgi:hypothetical protein
LTRSTPQPKPVKTAAKPRFGIGQQTLGSSEHSDRDMNSSSHQYYIVDVYQQPPGYLQPVVREHRRIVARSDAEAIEQAQAIFSLPHAISVTGFAVRAIGSRRFGDQAIYRHDKAARMDAALVKHAAD